MYLATFTSTNFRCKNVQEYEYALFEKYYCDACVPQKGASTWKKTVATHRHEDDREVEKDKPVQVGSQKWIEDFIETESSIPPPT